MLPVKQYDRREQLINEIANAVRIQLHLAKRDQLLNEGFMNWVKGGIFTLAMLFPNKLMNPVNAVNFNDFKRKMSNLEVVISQHNLNDDEKVNAIGSAAVKYVENNPQDTVKVYELVLDMSETSPELKEILPIIEPEEVVDKMTSNTAPSQEVPLKIYPPEELLKALKRSGVNWYHLSTFSDFYEKEYNEKMGVNIASLKSHIKQYPDRFTIVDDVLLRDNQNDPTYSVTTVGVILHKSDLIGKNGGSRIRVPVYDAGIAAYLVH